jgi:hypothetical protein
MPSPAQRAGPASQAQPASRTAARTSPQHRPRSQSLNLRTARRPPSDCSGPGSWHGSGWGGGEYRPSPPRSCPLPLGSGSAGHPPCRNPPSGRTRRATRAAALARLGGAEALPSSLYSPASGVEQHGAPNSPPALNRVRPASGWANFVVHDCVLDIKLGSLCTSVLPDCPFVTATSRPTQGQGFCSARSLPLP